MSDTKRHRGYVVAVNELPDGRVIWKVRVKDSESPFDGLKYTVVSTHKGITLARGLNVSFLIGSVDDEEGNRVPRAVDVMVEGQEVNQSGGGR